MYAPVSVWTPPVCAVEVIRSKGLERITVDELVQIITPRGRGTARALPLQLYMFVVYTCVWFLGCGFFGFCAADTVPDQIKADLLQRIRQFLQST